MVAKLHGNAETTSPRTTAPNVWKYNHSSISWDCSEPRESNRLLGYFYNQQIILKNGVFEDTVFKMCDHLQSLLSVPLSHLYFQGCYQETVGS